MNLRLILLLSLSLASCRTTKTITQTKEVEKVVYKAVTDSIVIEKACDSVGKLKVFEKKIKAPQGEITIRTINNVIRAEIKLDSIVSTKEVSTQKKTITKYRTPRWVLITLFISVILNILLIKIKI